MLNYFVNHALNVCASPKLALVLTNAAIVVMVGVVVVFLISVVGIIMHKEQRPSCEA